MKLHRAAIFVSMAFAISGCSQSPNAAVTGPSLLNASGAATAASAGADVNRSVAAVRAAVAPYHNLDKAIAAGYVQITDCLALPGVGGMGFHYAQLPFDATAEALAPESLVYAPLPNGGLKLAAVEYIIPQPLWTSAQPPSLFGQDFHRNDELNIWALHLWLFENNPLGMFEDWNPRVSCGS